MINMILFLTLFNCSYSTVSTTSTPNLRSPTVTPAEDKKRQNTRFVEHE